MRTNKQYRFTIDKNINPIINAPTRVAKRKLLMQLNATQAKKAALYIGADVFWRERSNLVKPGHKNVARKLKRLERFIESKLKEQGAFSPELNDNGCVIERSCYPERGRYYYDFRLTPSNGWTNYSCDSDAPYFGLWVNINAMEILKYCEGDVEHVFAPNPESFKLELQDLVDRYQPAPSLTVIDANGIDEQFKQNAVHDYLKLNVNDLVRH